MQHTLKHRAKEFEHEKQHEMRVGVVNLISDSITLVTFLIVLAKRNEGRRILTNTIGRVSQGMSQTGKAFILILVADVLMGYHSEEGWTAGIELLCEHYGVEALVCSPALISSCLQPKRHVRGAAVCCLALPVYCFGLSSALVSLLRLQAATLGRHACAIGIPADATCPCIQVTSFSAGMRASCQS